MNKRFVAAVICSLISLIYSKEISLESTETINLKSGSPLWQAIFSNSDGSYITDTSIVEHGASLLTFNLNAEHEVTLFVAGFGSRSAPFALFEQKDDKYRPILNGNGMNIEIMSEDGSGYPRLRTYYYDGPCFMYETIYWYDNETARYTVKRDETKVTLCND